MSEKCFRGFWAQCLSPGLALALLCSCGQLLDSGEQRREPQVHQDEGALCLRSSSSGALRVTVTFPGCLSSSCDRKVSAVCEVHVADSEIRVDSDGVVESTGADACTDDCGFLTAECEAPDTVPTGEYVVRHGSDEQTVTLPSSKLKLFEERAPGVVDCDF